MLLQHSNRLSFFQDSVALYSYSDTMAVKINYMEDRLFGIFDKVFDLVSAIDGRLKVIEAVLTAPPASNTRSHS